jgi:septum site-determining protein MinD
VPDDERVIVSSNKGEPLVLGTEQSMAGTAYSNIIRRLEGERVPFQDLTPPKEGFFDRLKKVFTRSIG